VNITLIAGARPNFMKIAPIIEAITTAKEKGHNINYRLVHTGQHFDQNMSGNFFDQLRIPAPDVNLECGGGSQAEQTANIMVRFEKELIEHPADLVMVVGDVTSTMACAITAQKLHTKVAHVEGGIRSGDWNMPEEINRLATDAVSNYFFTTSDTANQNLLRSGVEKNRIFFVGNTMIDTLYKNLDRLQKPEIWENIGLEKGNYITMTLHRPGNVDEANNLKDLMESIVDNSRGIPLVFPVHPRTAKTLKSIGIDYPNLHLIPPLGYLEFIYLIKNAKAVITDSGGITEETTVLGIPCITLRDSTERPETVSLGTNELIGINPKAIPPVMNTLFEEKWKKGTIPELWDGKTAERIIGHLLNVFTT
jgi:UDP-N-acetylglucosamine 2-epimerase (non-hydrolysing)